MNFHGGRDGHNRTAEEGYCQSVTHSLDRMSSCIRVILYVAVMESIFKPNIYGEVYLALPDEFQESWAWDSETKTKSEGLYSICASFAHIVSFVTTINAMEPLRPLVKKLQRKN